MLMATKRYVRPAGDGWGVFEEGQRRTVIHSDTQNKARSRAREIVQKSGGGEVRVVNRVGKIVSSDKIGKPTRTST
jgi:hypothetical protein